MIGASDAQVAEQALALLRNVVCTYDEDAEPAFGLAGVGEDRLLSIITARLIETQDDVMLEHVSVAGLGASVIPAEPYSFLGCRDYLPSSISRRRVSRQG